MKTNINLRHLKVFIAVAEAGSFTRAAEKLLLSQSSLTVTMRQLETDLGVRLLNRTTRQVEMTADGIKFLANARHVIEEFNRMLSATRLSASQRGGTVRIAVLPSIAIRLMPDVITQVNERYQDIRIVLRDDNARGLHRQLRESEVDFGISNVWQEYPELEYVPLTRDRFGLICRKDDPLVLGKTSISWNELTPEKLFIMASDTGVYTALKQYPELGNLIAAPAGEVLVMVTLLEMVRAGLGVTVLPELARPGNMDTDLIYLPLTSPVVERKICLIRRHNEPLSSGARLVWDALLGRIPKLID